MKGLPNNGIKLTSGGSSRVAARFAAVSVAVASWGAIIAGRAACSLSRCSRDIERTSSTVVGAWVVSSWVHGLALRVCVAA